MTHGTPTVAATLALLVVAATANGTQLSTPPSTPQSDAKSTPPAAATDGELIRRIEALERENATQREEIEALTDRLDEQELQDLQEVASEFEPFFMTYGFFDVSLTRWFIEEGDLAAVAMPGDLTFAAADFNLYFLSQMTETINFLAEVRFTYLPHGAIDITSFKRVDTSVQDPHQAEIIQLGGIHIERVRLVWQPRDWFGITAGRYITPFGIWNIDHGSPVLPGAYAPYIMLTELVPLRQTGLMVHGRFVPTEHLLLDYAVTLSNGRGPAEQVYDLDNNKGVGLRLKGTFENDTLKLALGGYGFFSRSTDEALEPVSIEPIEITKKINERSWELTGSADLLLELFGVRLQVEYARSIRRYQNRPGRTLPMVGAPVPGVYQPDTVAWVAYLLAAWTLPLDKLLGEMKLMPYVMIERSVPEDVTDEFSLWSYHGGINFRPNSVIVLKLDAGRADFTNSKYFHNPIWIVGTQVAVAF